MTDKSTTDRHPACSTETPFADRSCVAGWIQVEGHGRPDGFDNPEAARVSRSREDVELLDAARAESRRTESMDKPRVLTRKELTAIMPRLSGWKLADNKLRRTFEFQDFVQSLSFVNSLVAYFETVDHHPDVYIAYGEVTFELTRYDLGGKVTDRDVEVAKKISSVYRARS
jgi:4a-hydroxytetrahydrobiopterin dehydratase